MKLSSRTKSRLRRIAKAKAERRGTDWEDEVGEVYRKYINGKRKRKHRA